MSIQESKPEALPPYNEAQADSSETALMEEYRVLRYELDEAKKQFPNERSRLLIPWISRQRESGVRNFRSRVIHGRDVMKGIPARQAMYHILFAEKEFLKRLNNPDYEGPLALSVVPELIDEFTNPEELGIKSDGEWFILPDDDFPGVYVPPNPQAHVSLWLKEMISRKLGQSEELHLKMLLQYVLAAVLHGDSDELRSLAKEVKRMRDPKTGRLKRPTPPPVKKRGVQGEIHRALLEAFDKVAARTGKLPVKKELWEEAQRILKRQIDRRKRPEYMEPLGLDVLPDGRSKSN